MPETPVDQEKFKETGMLVAGLSAPFLLLCYVDNRVGVTASLAVAGAVLYKLWEVGKNQRPDANAFFKKESVKPEYQAIQDTTNAGSALYRQLTSK